MKCKEKLLFATLYGQFRGHDVGMIMEGSCLPLVASNPEYDYGFTALWQANLDVGIFFEKTGIDHTPSPGLWVVEIEYDTDDYEEAVLSEFDHLSIACKNGELRRLTHDELEGMTDGKLPWESGEWL